MVWSQLDINKPHLVYIILGGFTSLFMLCSSIIKEKFYIGEATVATLCGLIFGPHAANLIDPGTWGNTDQITLEFARVVLVVQCFAVGVELPRAYMERHWRSVVFLLVPVMTFGWLITSLFIWGMFTPTLNWLDSLTVAACVTATDPVLASSVVGKGKFAKRVPKHLRDLLSAESGCNDGMAFPFIYLAIYLVRYRPDADQVALHWICITILYECVFGAIYGVTIGYIARRAIRAAHERNLIDRESFLVFYFVLALFCAGSGSLLGMDDLLIGFAAGVGFSNDGWFTEKTEESHVSNVIDLLINLAFFVYFGTIIPWAQFNSAIIGTEVWKLVVIAILVLFFRRIPIMMALKPMIPDVKTWREALFAGHFGPIGVGAIFVAILARAEIETDTTTPLAVLPEPGFEHLNIIELIWPITTFLVLTSIIVHGSSIAVFTLGKHINTLTITMSYTQATEEQGNWMDRLPRIQSRSKSSMSMQKPDDSDLSLVEKLPDYPSPTLPRNFLRRQKTEDTPKPLRSSSRRRNRRSKYSGHVEQSAIAPQHRDAYTPMSERSESETLGMDSESSPQEKSPQDMSPKHRSDDDQFGEPEQEVYQEGHKNIIEDEEGNVLEVMESHKDETSAERKDSVENEVRRLMTDEDIHHGVSKTEHPDSPQSPVQDALNRAGSELKRMISPESADAKGENDEQQEDERPEQTPAEGQPSKRAGWKGMTRQFSSLRDRKREERQRAQQAAESERRRGPARAFRFGRTIIVEDEDGEVIKKYDIPQRERDTLERKQSYVDPEKAKQRLARMGKMLGVGSGGGQDEEEAEASSSRPQVQRRKSRAAQARENEAADDLNIRFTMEGDARRMSRAEFIKQIEAMDPRARAQVVEESNAPEAVKREARADAREHDQNKRKASEVDAAAAAAASAPADSSGTVAHAGPSDEEGEGDAAAVKRVGSHEERPKGPEGLSLVTSRNQEIPFHSVGRELRAANMVGGETAAQRRRRLAAQQRHDEEPARPREDEQEDSDDDGTERVPPSRRRQSSVGSQAAPGGRGPLQQGSRSGDVETAAERRRRLGALGISKEHDSDEEEAVEEAPRQTAADARRGIRFMEPKSPRGDRAGGGSGPSVGQNVRWKQR